MASINGVTNQTLLIVKDSVAKLVTQYFQSTLGQERDIVNIFAALCLYESSLNPTIMGPTVSSRPGTFGYKYLTSSAVSTKLAMANSTEEQNIQKGLNAFGICQVMGWNIVKGGSSTGQCEIERLRPDLVPLLVINPGEDPGSRLFNISNCLTAGLAILEGKYKSVFPSAAFYGVKGDRFNRRFSSKIQAAVAAYLGLGAADLNNTDPISYSMAIVGGRFYTAVVSNQAMTSQISSNVKNKAPSTDGTNLAQVNLPGCPATN